MTHRFFSTYEVVTSFFHSLMNPVDGAFGTLINEETNSFNGMIGMVQRRVSLI